MHCLLLFKVLIFNLIFFPRTSTRSDLDLRRRQVAFDMLANASRTAATYAGLLTLLGLPPLFLFISFGNPAASRRTSRLQSRHSTLLTCKPNFETDRFDVAPSLHTQRQNANRNCLHSEDLISVSIATPRGPSNSCGSYFGTSSCTILSRRACASRLPLEDTQCS